MMYLVVVLILVIVYLCWTINKQWEELDVADANTSFWSEAFDLAQTQIAKLEVDLSKKLNV